MRGRIITAVLALAAFCASFGAPLQPLFASTTSCCPSGRMSACCRRHHTGAGWVGNPPACGGTCVCAFPSSHAPGVTPAALPLTGPTLTAAVEIAPGAAEPSSQFLAFLFQRPPPYRA